MKEFINELASYVLFDVLAIGSVVVTMRGCDCLWLMVTERRLLN